VLFCEERAKLKELLQAIGFQSELAGNALVYVSVTENMLSFFSS
jgi:hypothetical protein